MRFRETAGCLIELKSGAWSYSRVKAQFEGGFRMVQALKVHSDTYHLLVVADRGVRGATQALGGLQTVSGYPIRVVSGEHVWQ